MTLLRDEDAPAAEPGEPRELYPFQRHIAAVFPQRCNLLVASPTGSGKTFAIEEAARWIAQRPGEVLYVAQPLIALAEQVYTRLGGPREGLALRTGPVRQGDDEESIVVCTYEVLARKCLSDPTSLARCPLVVIDEVHYIASDRGAVIQEILHCCDERRIVALSGTLPNAEQFASFLASVNGLPTFVTGAASRPVPVSFFAYNAKAQRCAALRLRLRAALEARDIGGLNSKQDLLGCLRCLREHQSMPLLIVAFSCRKLDQFAEWAMSQDYLGRAEKSKVTRHFAQLQRRVPEEDWPLFALLREQALLGVGRHHSHLPVPYLQLVCKLASERLLKVVFATSTLSAGINLPVRTVVICGARVPQKRGDFEVLSPLLFQQLAGRAGRPGLEPEGFCVLCIKDAACYESAQALLARPTPPVLPSCELTRGDVLRGVLLGRRVALDRAVFANPSLRRAALAARAAESAAARALASSGQGESARRTAAAARLLLERPACLAYARAKRSEALFLVRAEGSLRVSQEGDVQLTAKQLPRRAPLQHMEEIQAAKAAVALILGAQPELLALASLVLAAEDQRAEGGPLAVAEEALLSSTPTIFLSDGVLTELGEAACCIRTVPDPCLPLQALLEAGDVSHEQLLVLLSQVMADGPLEDEAPSGRVATCLAALPVQLPERTRCEWTENVLHWREGAKLADLCSETCSVGAFCRHIVRLTDFLEELAQACERLALQELCARCRAEASQLTRGLPFARR